jgi:uncharacterized protein YukE
MRIGGGGGWGAITGNTYQIKTMPVASASASGMTASEIETLFSYLDPSAVAEAGKAHEAAAKTLQSTAESLVECAQALADGWSGTAAQASIGAFQQLHQTAVQLAQASAQTGEVLTWLGETILPYYKNWKAPSDGIVGTIESWFGSNPQDAAAQQVMQRLNDRLSQANAGLPASVSINPPKIGPPGRAPAIVPGPDAGRGAGAAAVGASLTGDVGGMVSPATSGDAVIGVHPGGPGGVVGRVPTTPGGHTSSPTHLAGLPSGGTPPDGGVGSLPGGSGGVPGGGVPGGGSGSLGSVPMPVQGTEPGGGGLPGDGAPGTGGALPGEPVVGTEPGAGGVDGNGPGGQGFGEGEGFPAGESAVMDSDGMIGTGPGIAGGEAGPSDTGATGFLGADDAATQPGDEFSSTGSSAGRRENERYRQAWMAEDVDIWEGETSVGPSLIGL